MTPGTARHTPPITRILRRALLLAAALALQCSRAEDAAGPSGQPAVPVVTSISQFWNMSAEQKARPCAFRLECDVTFVDPIWKILFVQDSDGDGAYVPSASLQFPFKEGQRIVASGLFVPPNGDVSFAHAVINPAGGSRATPRPLGGHLSEASQWASRLVTAEGFVDRYDRRDVAHLRITLSIEGQTLLVWVLTGADTPIPDLTDAVVRVVGVFNPKVGPDGNASSLEIMVQSMERVTIVNRLGDDPRFRLPVAPIGSLPKQAPDRLVRVSGQVKAQEPGHWVRIRDEGGQVDVMTGQLRPFSDDEWVEAVGYPLIKGAKWQLTGGLARAAGAAAAGAAEKPDSTLRLAAQVFELAPKEEEQGRAVWLTGVVTWSHRNAPFFFMEDSSRGICVMRAGSGSRVSLPGRRVEVQGVTGMGEYAPIVRATRFDQVSDLVLPVPEPTTLEQALTGSKEAMWVEMRGYLHGIRAEKGWVNLDLVTNAGDFVAVLPSGEDVSALVGAIVVVRGVCTAETGGGRRLTGIKLWVPSSDFVEIEEAPPKDPFDVPSRAIASLGQFDSAQSFNRLLRVSGVVLNHSPGRFIQIEEGGEGLLVFSEGREPLQAGDRVEAVGLLARQGARVTLREAIYRKAGRGDTPAATRMAPGYAPATEFDGRLVNIEGSLINSSATADQLRLTLQGSEAIFEAFLDRAAADRSTPEMPNGSDLSLTGVYTVRYDEYGRPSGYQLNLRTAGDIGVLKTPSWLTLRRVIGLAATLAVGILLFVAWVMALHRQVRRQTEQIREQMKREASLQADLQRAGKLESLGLLAGGIAHDFNNLLTVVMGNLSLARLDGGLEPEVENSLRDAERAAARARDLTQQLLTFAKGGAPIQAAVLLPDVVREVAEFALRGSKVRCVFDIPADLWPANVDKGQIGQVVQNIVINAMQAMPEGGAINVSMRNEDVGTELGPVLAPGRYLHLAFTDHGHGIRPGDLEKIFDPYFTTKKNGSGLGLATVHSIVKKHNGHIFAESPAGNGTTFHIWLPAARGAPAEQAASEEVAPPAPGAGKARLLFMDDEFAIRTVGCALLSRAGYAVTAVSEGGEALREYAEAVKDGRPYSVVILDLTIPGGMGGSQAMEQLLKLDPGVRAIVCSGYSNDAVLSNYAAYGFRGMVSKPYEAGDLIMAVERVLKGGRA